MYLKLWRKKMVKRKKKFKKGKCSLCEEFRVLKWKYKRDKKRPICEACHLARQCLNEAKLGKPMGYFEGIKEGLKEFWNEIKS